MGCDGFVHTEEEPEAGGGSRRRPRLRGLRGWLWRMLVGLARIRTPRQAWWFLAWLGAEVRRRILGWSGVRDRALGDRPVPGLGTTGRQPGDAPPLGAEIVALGPRSRAVFASSARVARRLGGEPVDVVVSDTPLAARGFEAPVVVLSEAAPRLSVPAFDPRIDNPIGWRREVEPVVGALGPLDLLPAGVEAHRVVRGDDREGLRRIHHLEDVAALHGGAVERAAELARLAAAGVVVHVADHDPRLRDHLGAELHDLMATGVRTGDRAARERLSIRMRRAALREHSLPGRARQVCKAGALSDPPLPPLVSVLLVTRRPAWLPAALAAVRRQTYPRVELVLGLHGDGFPDVEPLVAESGRLSRCAKVVRIDGDLPLGSALNAASGAASGDLLAKMDDDEVYGPEHLWDLVLAHEYSRAPLVGKGREFVYLAASDRTLRCFQGRAETRWTSPGGHVAGGALLVSRDALERTGGWRRVRCGEDLALQEGVVRAGGCVYRTHAAGFVHVRHGCRHAWKMEDARFLLEAETVAPGWNPALADLSDVPPPLAPPPGSTGG